VIVADVARHHRETLRRGVTPARKRVLALSARAAVVAQGWAFGLVEWFGARSVSAIGIAFVLPYRPRLPLYLSGPATAYGRADADHSPKLQRLGQRQLLQRWSHAGESRVAGIPDDERTKHGVQPSI
jgi:hypothetical protein